MGAQEENNSIALQLDKIQAEHRCHGPKGLRADNYQR